MIKDDWLENFKKENKEKEQEREKERLSEEKKEIKKNQLNEEEDFKITVKDRDNESMEK